MPGGEQQSVLLFPRFFHYSSLPAHALKNPIKSDRAQRINYFLCQSIIYLDFDSISYRVHSHRAKLSVKHLEKEFNGLRVPDI